MINRYLLSHREKLHVLVAHVDGAPFVVEARIEPSTFRPVSPTLYQLSYAARHVALDHVTRLGATFSVAEKCSYLSSKLLYCLFCQSYDSVLSRDCV
jgi:hypothetical protein